MKVTGEKILEIKKQMEAGEFVSSSKSPFFEGNPNLLKPNLEWDYTDSEKTDIAAVLKDPMNLVKCIKIRGNNLSLYSYQKDLLTDIFNESKVCLNKSRQIGCNMIIAIAMLREALLGKMCVAVFNKAYTGVQFMDTIKDIYKSLPYHLQKGIVKLNQKVIRFDNGGSLYTTTSSKSMAIGFTIDFLYIDEMAHIPPAIIEPLYRALYPTVTCLKDHKIVLASTPNGKNLFHKLFTEHNGFKKMCLPWYIVPNRNLTYLIPLSELNKPIIEQELDKREISWEWKDYYYVTKLDILEEWKLEWSIINGIRLGDLCKFSNWKEETIKDVNGIENFEQCYNNRFL